MMRSRSVRASIACTGRWPDGHADTPGRAGDRRFGRGVAALQVVLGALPAALPAPVLAVLHLPRDRSSRIADVLAPYCALPVREAEDKQPLQRGTVTFAPPDYHLLVEDARSLALSVDAPVLFSRPAIDPLFESAAAVFGDQVLALLLTGASSDGSEGVAAVRAVAAPGCNVPRRPRHR